MDLGVFFKFQVVPHLLHLQPTGSRYHAWYMFKNISTQVCVALKSSLCKAIVKYRARVFFPVTTRSYKRDNAVVKDILLAAAQGTKMCWTKLLTKIFFWIA